MPQLGRRLKPLVATLACLATATGLAACSTTHSEGKEFVVGVPEESLGSEAMPQSYADSLARHLVRSLSNDDRKAERKPVAADDRMQGLRSGETAVTFGCTGELLDSMDGNRATELRKEFAEWKKAEDSQTMTAEEWKIKGYDELLSALPSEIGATVVGEATPCHDKSLPENTVVLYVKHRVGREELGQMNHVVVSTSMEMLGA